MRLLRGLEHLFCADSLGLFSLEKRRMRGDLTVVFQYFKEACKQERNQCFTWMDSGRTRGNNFKLKEGDLDLMLGKSFTERVVKPCHRYGCPIPIR